ncbi:MAG: RluA family pseudouridine synthase [Spirochaetia bacterium]
MAEVKRLTFSTGRNDCGRRIDRVLRKFLPTLPLGAIYGGMRKRDIRVNGEKTTPDYLVRPGDVISVSPHFARKWEIPGGPNGIACSDIPRPSESSPSIRVILETPDLLVLDKPAGILIHGPGSLEEAVREYLAPKLPPSLSFTPGPLHRLDRNTSGAVFFGKSIRGARTFSELLTTGRLVKLYLAVVEGTLGTEAKWSDRITRNGKSKKSTARQRENPTRGGKVASLAAEPVAAGKELSLVRFTLHTGRTHQIRVQTAARDLPLAGDVKYGGHRLREPGIPGQGVPPYLLHAHTVRAADPEGAGELGIETVTAVPPAYFLEIVEKYFGTETVEKLSGPSTGRER